MIQVGIVGAAGRMGRALIEAVHAAPGLALAQAIEHAGHPNLGMDAGHLVGLGALDITLSDTLDPTPLQVLIDFTRPEATLKHAQVCAEAQCALVIGTTGFSEDQLDQLKQHAQKTPLLLAPNMSLGVHVLFQLARQAAAALGDSVDVEIIEAHHRHKVDAPSGTALKLGEEVADVLGRDLKNDALYGREGQTGARERTTIGFETIRAGDIVGEHTILFAGSGERLEITHRATSRANFAAGAVRACGWIADQAPGAYTMNHVLAPLSPEEDL